MILQVNFNKKEFFEWVQEILKKSENELITAKKIDGGTIPLENIRHTVSTVRSYLEYITLENINELPDPRFGTLRSKLIPFSKGIDLVLNRKNNDDQINELYSFFERIDAAALEKIWEITLESIVLGNRKKLNRPDNEKEKILNNLISKAEKTEKELNKIYDAAQTELANRGVGIHAKLFDDQARYHKDEAKKWRANIESLLAVDVVLIGIMLFVVLICNIQTHTRVHLSIISVALISLVSYAIYLCVKNYFAEKHNQSINEHRANALGTFNTFVNSATGEEKTAILLQATNTIFTFQKSGFLTKDTESINPNPVIEIFKKLMDESKK